MDAGKMKILSASVSNFGSYEQLQIDFTNQGLTLISGSTGSGKSTLCDVIPWILFGRTAKGGAVDEVRSWDSTGVTSGIITIVVKDKLVTVYRSRNPNDLYYIVTQDLIVRGKDLNDTQSFLNNLLGIDLDTYLTGAYINEFNQTATFFTANAKTRRALTEQLVDLATATNLTESTVFYKKELKTELNQLDKWLASSQAKKDQLNQNLISDNIRISQWEDKHKSKIADLQEELDTLNDAKILKFRAQVSVLKTSIRDLEETTKDEVYFKNKLQLVSDQLDACTDDKCPTCGNVKSNHTRLVLLKEENALRQQSYINTQNLVRLSDFRAQLDTLSNRGYENVELAPYKEQLISLRQEINPYIETIESNKDLIETLVKEIVTLDSKVLEIKEELADLDLLLEIIANFRIKLVKNTVLQLETITNKALADHFDAEIRVKFTAEDSDKLNIEVTKDGHSSTFSQLSKGQRQLLKLCFSVAVMKVTANHKGVSFDSIFLDEALEGMDEELRVKTYNLLQSLSTEHNSIFVVDHSPGLKAMFTNEIKISLNNGKSSIEKA